ncbi:TPA: hypothetical protein ACPH4Z_002202 [Pseudomonas aeruginosa]
MSRQQTAARTKFAQIADEGIEQIRYDQCHARWLAALMTAIHHELDRGTALLECRVSRAKDLASLGQHLGDDLANYTDSRVAELQAEFDLAEVITQ